MFNKIITWQKGTRTVNIIHSMQKVENTSVYPSKRPNKKKTHRNKDHGTKVVHTPPETNMEPKNHPIE